MDESYFNILKKYMYKYYQPILWPMKTPTSEVLQTPVGHNRLRIHVC